MDGVAVPRAYVLSRDALPDIVQSALAALSITPLCCVIISRENDSPLAHQFSDMVVRTFSEQDAMTFSILAFQETNMPSLIIGNSPGVTAIHEDGSLEEMNWQVLDSTIN